MARTATKEDSSGSTWKRILVATDFSPDAVWAVEVASQLARDLGAEVILLHVDEPLVEVARSNERARRRRKANRELERVGRALEARGVTVRWSLRIARPAQEIVQAAVREGAQLIVMGTRGHSPAISALLGGIAYEVVRKAPCPVLTVRVPAIGPRASRSRAIAAARSRQPSVSRRARARTLGRSRRRRA
jgi:nucleotide-binding universal stress UspA family protein